MTGLNGARVLNYVDWVKSLDSKGNFVNRVVNLAVHSNEMLDDMTVIEANNGTMLETTVRTETPTPVWTQYYGGVPSNKGSKAKIKVSCGTCATKITVDKNLFDESADKDAVLEDEITSAQEGMRLEMGNMLVYGKLSDNPLGFNGLHKSYCKYSTGAEDDRESAHYVLNAKGLGGTASDDTLGSIDLVGWSPNTITCFHPKGHKTGGIDITEKRVTDVQDTDIGGDATYEAYVRYLRWTLGLAVRDYRFGGRICNIQRKGMLLGTDKGAAYIEKLNQLCSRVHDQGVKQALYMDKQMFENLQIIFSRLTMANAITMANVEQRKERRIYGIPVRCQDSMKVNEEEVLPFA